MIVLSGKSDVKHFFCNFSVLPLGPPFATGANKGPDGRRPGATHGHAAPKYGLDRNRRPDIVRHPSQFVSTVGDGAGGRGRPARRGGRGRGNEPLAIGQSAFVFGGVGSMHNKSIGRALLLTALAALTTAGAAAPSQNFGEDYAPPDVGVPLPVGQHPPRGGRPVHRQPRPSCIARPTRSSNSSWRCAASPSWTPPPIFPTSASCRCRPSSAAAQAALDVQQVTGPNDYQPGFSFTLGYKFADGSAWEFKYLYITEVNLHASATEVPAGFNVGQNFENSFLFSQVFGFPNDYNGPSQKIASDVGRRRRLVGPGHLERRQHHDRAVPPADAGVRTDLPAADLRDRNLPPERHRRPALRLDLGALQVGRPRTSTSPPTPRGRRTRP